MKKGLFISFEGGEGAGKTTLIQGLSRMLGEREHSVIITREPGGTKLGEHVRNLLLMHSKDIAISPYAELALFLASRAQHTDEVIRPALDEGKIVLCDRFNDSSIAYQGHARGLGMERVEKICSFFSKNIQPDVTFYLDLDPKVGLNRNDEHDRIESEEISFHEMIRKGYLELAKRNPIRIHVIDASRSMNAVLTQVFRGVEETLQSLSL